MNASNEFLKKQNIVPFISFKENPRHTVTLKEDKQDQLTNDKGQQVFGITYIVEENGEIRKFFTSSIGLIQKLSQHIPGEEVTITMKGKKGNDGKWKTFFVVTSSKDKEQSEMVDDNEIPVIEENNDIDIEDIPL